MFDYMVLIRAHILFNKFLNKLENNFKSMNGKVGFCSHGFILKRVIAGHCLRRESLYFLPLNEAKY